VPAWSGACRAANCRTDHDVAEEQWHVGGIRRCPIGTATGRLAVLDDLGLGGVDRKGQHVGRARFAHVAVVELGHLPFADEEHGHLRQSAHTLGQQHVERELLPTAEIDGDVVLLVGTEHLRHSVTADPLLTGQPRSPVVAHLPAALRSAISSSCRP
jgi:hypothetical protein